MGNKLITRLSYPSPVFRAEPLNLHCGCCCVVDFIWCWEDDAVVTWSCQRRCCFYFSRHFGLLYWTRVVINAGWVWLLCSSLGKKWQWLSISSSNDLYYQYRLDHRHPRDHCTQVCGGFWPFCSLFSQVFEAPEIYMYLKDRTFWSFWTITYRQ